MLNHFCGPGFASSGAFDVFEEIILDRNIGIYNVGIPFISPDPLDIIESAGKVAVGGAVHMLGV